MVLGQVGLLLLAGWSILMFALGLASPLAGRPAAELDGNADPPGVGSWLVVVLAGLLAMLVLPHGSVFGLPVLPLASLPIGIAYSALLFDAGRRHTAPGHADPQAGAVHRVLRPLDAERGQRRGALGRGAGDLLRRLLRHRGGSRQLRAVLRPPWGRTSR